MNHVRPPAVAGMFYPAEREELHRDIEQYLREAKASPANELVPKAIVVPHAGYVYSGPVAATAYSRLRPARDTIRRVILLGPSHRVPLFGLATSSATAFTTPLGSIPIDSEALKAIADLPQVRRMDEAHALEHSLEVQLPFLQEVLHDFTLVPLVVGDASPAEVAEVLERLWGGPETLIVISSDLSHYHDYYTAQRLDRSTSRAIETLNLEEVHAENACGCRPLAGLLYLARQKRMKAETLDLRNSGDTAGSRDQVVGYGAYVLH